jgi:hypothetical protein
MILSIDHPGNSGCRIGLASACHEAGTGQFIRNFPQGALAALDLVRRLRGLGFLGSAELNRCL